MNSSLHDAFKQVRFLCDEDGVPDHFFIVTACNPDGVTVSENRNAKADQSLKETIDQLGFSVFRVTGGDFDFSHAEPGWGISCSRDQAKALAVSYRQLAFFEIRDGKVLLIVTDATDAAPEDLGKWALRLDDGEVACPFCLTRAMSYPCDHLLTTYDSLRGSWTLEEGFHESIYDELVKVGLASPPEAEDPSEEEEERRTLVIRETLHAVADRITTGELNQGPGFSSNLEFLWVQEPAEADARLRKLLAAGGAKSAERT